MTAFGVPATGVRSLAANARRTWELNEACELFGRGNESPCATNVVLVVGVGVAVVVIRFAIC